MLFGVSALVAGALFGAEVDVCDPWASLAVFHIIAGGGGGGGVVVAVVVVVDAAAVARLETLQSLVSSGIVYNQVYSHATYGPPDTDPWTIPRKWDRCC